MRSLVGTILDRTPVSYAPSGRLSLPFMQRNDAEAQMKAYGSVGTLFAIVNGTSSGTAQVDWKLYRKAASGKEEDRTEVTRHAALDLWNKPNTFFTRAELVETTQQHGDLTGEGWWVVGRDPRASLPLELWPVRPDRIHPVPSARDFIAGYVYTGPDGEKVPLDVDDVIMPIRMPNPLDPYRGLGPVQAILVDLDATKYSAEWNRNFFLNSAEPGGLVESERRLTDDEFDEWAARWREQHQGVAQAHRVAVLEQGMKWVDRKYTMRDMQFAELRGVSREIIREAFRFPKPLLGSVDDVNRANAVAAEVLFARWLLVPRLERIKGALNNDLLPLYGPGSDKLEFDYDDPTPQDAEAENAERDSRVMAVVALINLGFDPAETMEAFELPDLKFEKPAPPPALAGGPPGAPGGAPPGAPDEGPPPPPE